MYPYHNRIKQRIHNGELVDHYYTADYPRIGEALVLRPVRPHRRAEYEAMLGGIGNDT